MSINSEKSYFPSLTGVRAIAAYMVFFVHFNPFIEQGNGHFLKEFFSRFHVGVTLFFVLSGFLITYRYYDVENFSFKQYFYNRLARIYPLFFIITTVTLLIRAYTQPSGSVTQILNVYLLNITFLKGFFGDFFFTGLLQGWSLTVEESFYLAAPFIFFLVKKTKFFLLLLPIGLITTGILLVNFFSEPDFYGFFANYKLMFSGTFFGRCIEFFGGICLALFVKENKFIKAPLPLTYLGILLIVFCIYLIPVKSKANFYTVELWDVISASVLLPISIVIFFYGLLTERSLIFKLLSSRFFVLLGKSSYAFYLIHIGYVSSLIRMFTGNLLFLFILENVAAIIIYFLVEEPVRRYLKNKSVDKLMRTAS